MSYWTCFFSFFSLTFSSFISCKRVSRCDFFLFLLLLLFFCFERRYVFYLIFLFSPPSSAFTRSSKFLSVSNGRSVDAANTIKQNLPTRQRSTSHWGVLIYKSVSDLNVTIVQPRNMNFMGKTAFIWSNFFIVRFAHIKNLPFNFLVF